MTAPLSRQYIRRRRSATLMKLLAGFVFVCAAVLADRAGLFSKPASDDYGVYNGRAARVVKVVDGDTLDIDVPDRVGGYRTTRVRLLGIDTPETKRPDTPVQPFGPEASARTTELTLGKEVKLLLPDSRRTRGNHGRLLAYVILPDGAVLNRLLVGEGLAYADPRYPHPRMDDFQSEMSVARRHRRGLWQQKDRSSLPYYLRE